MSTLVGRDREMSELATFWRGISAGQGRIVVVTSEPGGGKTALLRSFVDGAEGSAQVAWGECTDGATGAPFTPWVQAFEDDTTVRALIQATDESARFEQFRNAAAHVLDAKRRVIVIDDLHWADGASLRFLDFVTPRVRDSSTLLIVATRPRPSAAVQSAIGTLLRHGAERIDLQPLTKEDLAKLATGAPPDRVDLVDRLSGGNPLLATEYLRHLASGGDDKTTPSSLTALIQVELGKLTPEARRFANVCSLFDSEIDRTAALTAAEAASSAVDELLDASLLVDRGRHWRHDSLREATRAGIPHSQREAFEATLAGVYAARGDESGVALHGCRAGAAWNPPRAHAAAVEQARYAATCYSLEHAEGFVNLSRSIRPLVRLTDAQKLALALFEGVLLTRLHRDTEGRTTLRHAAEVARAVDDPSALATIALSFGLGYEHGLASDPEVVALLREALSCLPRAEHSARAKLLARLAWQALSTDEVTLRRQLAQESVREARQSEDPVALAYSLLALCWGLPGPGDLPGRRAACEEALRLASESHDVDLHLSALFRHFIVTLESGDLPGARRSANAFNTISERYPLPYHRWNAYLFNATLALVAGDTATAQTWAARIDPPATGQPRQAEVQLSALRGHIAAQLGGAEAHRGAREMCAEIESYLGLGWLFGPRATVESDPSAAEQLATTALTRLLAAPVDEDRLSFLILLAETAVLTGSAPLCASLFEALQPFAHQWAVIANGAACRGPVASFLATTARVAGRLDEANHYESMAREDITRNNAPGLATWLELRPLPKPSPALSRPHGLTARENEVLALVARGHSNLEIAASLVLSVRTVERHIENIYRRLGIHSRAEAALRAVDLGLVAASDQRLPPS